MAFQYSFENAWLTLCIDLNADSYDFNNHAYQRFVEKLKVSILSDLVFLILTTEQDAVDPNGILSPGKQGMWPERYREFRDPTGKEADPSTGIESLVAETANAKL